MAVCCVPSVIPAASINACASDAPASTVPLSVALQTGEGIISSVTTTVYVPGSKPVMF